MLVGVLLVTLTCAIVVQLAYSIEVVPTVSSAPPSLAHLPSDCPSASSVSALIEEQYPGATFDPSYMMGTGLCSAAPTVVLPDGEQLAVVIQGGQITSSVVLKAPVTSSLTAGFSRWSGYEAYSKNTVSLFGQKLQLQNEQVIVADAQRTIPTVQVPSDLSSENATAQGLCCAFSQWVGQVDAPGGTLDYKLIQIGVDQVVGPLSSALGVRYVGFYEALPGGSIYFNSTQIPCGMPGQGATYESSVINEGSYNVTYWQYALTFANSSCAGSRYVVYVMYPMSGQYAEVQSEAPAACIAGVVEKQEQLPQFSDDRTVSTALSFNAMGSVDTQSLSQASANNYVISLNQVSSDTYNSGPEATGGGFSTFWVASGISGLTQFC